MYMVLLMFQYCILFDMFSVDVVLGAQVGAGHYIGVGNSFEGRFFYGPMGIGFSNDFLAMRSVETSIVVVEVQMGLIDA